MFGDKLKEARKQKKIKQSDLAKAIGTTNTTISNWENNISKPDIDTIELICGVLQISPNYFFSNKVDLSSFEYALIEKYRYISKHSQNGKKTVDDILEREYEVAQAIRESEERSKSLETIMDEQGFGEKAKQLIRIIDETDPDNIAAMQEIFNNYLIKHGLKEDDTQ